MSLSVAIMGHSFVNRLRSCAKEEWGNLRIDPESAVIQFFGCSGGTLRQFQSAQFMRNVLNCNPKHLICQIGDNDLDCANKSEEEILCSMLSYVNFLHYAYNFERIVLMQLLFRQKTRNIAVSEYNSRVIYLNKRLKEAASELPWLRYWKHKGLKHCAVYPYCNDGVHLNAFGMQRYMRSVRGAVLDCCRHNSEL